MRPGPTVYPVDRYLVESSNKMEMVNVNDDEIWISAPAIRPEDEAMLGKLHEMLQATADDLKLISGELAQHRQPKPQTKVLPTPLDEEFNEKVHIEEIVNSKFHRCNIDDKPLSRKPQKNVETRNGNLYIKTLPKTVNASVQVNRLPKSTQTSKKNLAISHTKIVQIDEQYRNSLKDVKLNNARSNVVGPFISYNEFSHTDVEPKAKYCNQKPLRVQEMPSINIRSELKEQKVLQLDIIPEQKVTENIETASNVAVIALQHEPAPRNDKRITTSYPHVKHTIPAPTKPTVRRISRMISGESSELTNNVSSDAQDKIITQNVAKPARPLSRPISAHIDSKTKRNTRNKIAIETQNHRNINEWKKKLNTIYGHPSTSSNRKTCPNTKLKTSPTKSRPIQVEKNCKSRNKLNNAEYIPYSKLTLGGIRVSDIEREISDIPDKNIPLSPILDKILTSRENSFHNKPKIKEGNKNVLTTSDEDLLEEVLDIERNVSEALAKNLKERVSPSKSKASSESGGSVNHSYADDFEADRTEHENSLSDEQLKNTPGDEPHESNVSDHIQAHAQNTTYTKSLNLSFKESVDIFEFVHSIDTRDHATQSNPTYKISLKATQTSPRNIQPIRNDLWPTENSKEEAAKKLNEELIKKMIVDECSDILKKNLAEPSTCKDKEESKKNFAASQKNTQTSPAHVRSVMTSPTKTKTRTTSPFALSLAVDRQTSPLVATNAEELRIELDEIDDLAVSINLSSPRFSLRLPRTSRDVLSNLDAAPSKLETKPSNIPTFKIIKKCSSSSSADGDYSSSDISSLGEIEKNKFKRKLRKAKMPTASESSGSSVVSKYSSDISSFILPLKSEGEVSVGNVDVRKSRFSKSDGEVSVGQTLH